ncbi:uncharacterized protein B0H64DRAFT_384715 [Chaetomium fimeti]|uniref:Uncharacterized protein n=1 Tax=Chaetomium fimeti TaxID=1854472 RepID=A0AAE0HKP0_9PEZI|nr:hypothetical protein B0H64DRAFT_384715 [Chaetomium fimeti]
MHTGAAIRGHCLCQTQVPMPEALRARNVWRYLGLFVPPPLRVHLTFGPNFPLCPCPPFRPKMERKWKCKPGEANAVSQVPVCRSPTPSLP